ncbi:MAG TPA: DUF1735 domain-containing protein [Ferruginibacter sp.]|nr:DUF1735 domain-containing protein [Ferruginibacter sp.]HRE63088.1 DUF1735 domain-containing protein [Ferruginibacter sp.]
MKIFKYTRQLAAFSALAFVLASCDKVDEPTPLGDDGVTIVKVANGGTFDEPGTNLIGVDFIDNPQSTILVDIRRDVPSTAEMNTTQKVVVKVDTALLTAYNAANGSDFIAMPASWYSTNPAITWGGSFELTFNPGELGKQLKINIPNASLFDPAATYAFPFTIVSASPDQQISVNKSFIQFIGAKNSYDGVYTLVWTNYHPSSNPGYTGGETTMHMVTTASNKCKSFWPLGGGYGAPAILGGSLSWFGAQEPEYTFDEVTNKVTVQNSYSGATTFYTMNPNFNSHYDPAAKTISVKWGYSYTNGNFDPAASREWTQLFTYTGPR